MDRIDWSAIAVGDTLWMAERQGWSTWRAEAWEVTKRTPSGQLTVCKGSATERVTPRGMIIGSNGPCDTRHFVSESEAQAINAQFAIHKLWLGAVDAAVAIEKAARNKSLDGCNQSIAELQEVMRTLGDSEC